MKEIERYPLNFKCVFMIFVDYIVGIGDHEAVPVVGRSIYIDGVCTKCVVCRTLIWSI